MKVLGDMQRRIVFTLLAAACALPAWAGGIDDFSLTRAIPADAFLAVHTRNHEGLTFLNKQYQRVWQALASSRIDRDIRRMIKDLTKEQGQDPEEFERVWQQITDLLAGVDWATLSEREFAFAMKLEFPAPEMVMLFKPKAETIGDSFTGLAAMLKELAKLDEENLQFAEDKQGDLETRKLTATGMPSNYGLMVARYKDTLLVAMGSGWVEQSLAMLAGKGGEPLAKSARFQEAFKKLPVPTDELVFYDAARMMTGLRDVFKKAIAESGAAEPEEGQPDPQKLLTRVLDAFDMFDYIASVATTKDKQTVGESICVLKADAAKHALYPALFGNPPIKEPLKYIPKSASDVSVSSGVDLQKFYAEAIKFVREEIPDAEAHLAEWEAQQEQWQFNVDKDLLSWLAGDMCEFKIPGATAFSPGEFCMMFGVRDEKKAAETIQRGMDALAPLLQQQSGLVEEIKVAGSAGFHAINHPFIGMLGLKEPTLGVKDGMLFFASSPKVIELALDTAAGKSENFGKNERFLKEGLPPASNVVSLSFSDTTEMGKNIGQGLRMAPMLAQMAGPEMGKNPAMKAIFQILGKLGPVFDKLDFLLSTAEQSTFDGKVVKSKSVTNYREPPVEKAPATQSGADKPADE